MGISSTLVTLLRGMGTNDTGGGTCDNDDAEYENGRLEHMEGWHR
jgi:hypothetical protein